MRELTLKQAYEDISRERIALRRENHRLKLKLSIAQRRIEALVAMNRTLVRARKARPESGNHEQRNG
jgi:hypothetical protein